LFRSVSAYAGPNFIADTVCANTPTHFTILNPFGVTAVHWDFGDFFPGDTSNVFNPTYTYNSEGIYTVKLFFYSISGMDSIIKSVLVIGIPNPTLLDNVTLCVGTYGLNANYPYGDTYLWNTGATTQGITYNQPGTYWVQVSNMCGSGADTGTIFFLSPPGAVLPPLAYLCSISDSITLNAGPVTNQYQWSTGETTDSIIVNQPGSYLVQVSNVCGVGNYYCNVSYSSPPSVEIGPADTVLCGTQTFFLNELIPTCNDCLYEWSDGSTTPFNIISSGGTVWVSISNSCGVASDTMHVTNLSYSYGLFTTDDTLICNDEVLNFDASFPGADYLWQDGTTSPLYTIDTSGLYWVRIHNFCSTYIDTLNVKKLTLNLDLNIGDSLLCRGDSIHLNVSQPEGVYLWNNGSTDSTYMVKQEGYYEVSVSNSCGTLSDDFTVYYQDCNECIHIPTAFSPNGDGHNDYFHVFHDCLITDFHLHIYNRWGQQVFETDDPDGVWDGKFLGKNLSVDVFTYTINYSKTDFVNTYTDFFQGNITLLR